MKLTHSSAFSCFANNRIKLPENWKIKLHHTFYFECQTPLAVPLFGPSHLLVLVAEQRPQASH